MASSAHEQDGCTNGSITEAIMKSPSAAEPLLKRARLEPSSDISGEKDVDSRLPPPTTTEHLPAVIPLDNSSLSHSTRDQTMADVLSAPMEHKTSVEPKANATTHTETAASEAVSLSLSVKMSTDPSVEEKDVKAGTPGATQATGGSEGNEKFSKKKRFKKRKVVMFFCYCGEKYQGMQRNPGAVTIEGILEAALNRAGAIENECFGDMRSVDWARAARTDKGVSAVGQVVSGRMVVEPAGFVDRVNKELPQDIRLLGYKRVTNGFNAKQLCDRRRYEYVIPTFAFDPEFLKTDEGQLGCSGSGEVGIGKDCFSSVESETLNGSLGQGGLSGNDSDLNRNATSGNETVTSDASEKEKNRAQESQEERSRDAEAMLEVALDEKKKDDVRSGFEVTEGGEIGDSRTVNTTNGTTIINASGGLNQAGKPGKQSLGEVDGILPYCISQGGEGQLGKSFAVFDEKTRARLDKILSLFEGTHNFYNFTSRIRPEDPSALRYILSFKTVEVFHEGGIEFVKCHVLGQSFMLHQIRKMIGLAVAIMRGCAPESIIATAFRRDRKINTPIAPEVGLFLDECLYTGYNRKYESTHEEVSLDCFQEQVDTFKHNVIYPHIAAKEKQDQNVRMFLLSLNESNHPDFVSAWQEEKEKLAKAVTTA